MVDGLLAWSAPARMIAQRRGRRTGADDLKGAMVAASQRC
jgi:hypothetical protein